jgi:hypothetical protein
LGAAPSFRIAFQQSAVFIQQALIALFCPALGGNDYLQSFYFCGLSQDQVQGSGARKVGEYCASLWPAPAFPLKREWGMLHGIPHLFYFSLHGLFSHLFSDIDFTSAICASCFR